ncbi:MAG: hypothetical protein U0992_11350 [Planctomycetaceae bacterium]
MSSRLRRLIGCCLLAIYGGMAVLGHGGLHALQADEHLHATADSVAASHAHGHTHHGCCHHHPQQQAANQPDSQPAQHHEHRHNGPAHDHDNCVICQHFAAGAVLVAFGAPLNLIAGIERVAQVATSLSTVEDSYLLPIRGPPAAC